MNMPDLQAYILERARRIDEALARFLPRRLSDGDIARYVGPVRWEQDADACTEMLATPIWDMVNRRGKRWRPIFALLVLEALGQDSEPYEVLLAAIAELPHTGALIIDDIEDGSAMRRGDECIHLRYGTDVAINAANAAYFLPLLLVRDSADLSDAQKLDIFGISVAQFVRAHFGQSQDIYWSRNMTRDRLAAWVDAGIGGLILQAYEQKSGAAVAGPAEVACVIAGANQVLRNAVAQFARTFGVAFQMIDDVLDFADADDRRKPLGKDVSEGKLTYPILKALQLLPAPDRSRLQDAICSPELRAAPTTLSEAIELVRRSGVLEECRGEAQAMVDDAWEQLSPHLPPSDPKSLLRLLCEGLISADNPT